MMGGGSATIPAKRPPPSSSTEIFPMTNPSNPNHRSQTKRSKKKPPANSASADLIVPPGHASFRLLCHFTRIGGVIGKSGAVIKSLQLATSAKIRVEVSPEDSPDRVITVVAQAGPAKAWVSLRSQHGGGSEVEAAEVTKAQEALLRVFDRILEVAAESGAVGAGGFGVVSCRMLVDATGASAVIGKGGKVVERIKKESGTKIKVFKDNLPSCAASTDEMIEIEGNVLAVKKALISVSQCLQDRSLSENTRSVGNIPIEGIPQETKPDLRADHLSHRNLAIPTVTNSSIHFPGSSIGYAQGVYPLPLESERVHTLGSKTKPRDIVFKLLCSNEKIGGVIGKGGLIVKALQNETGASISVGASVPDCDDRLITISASEDPESRYSPAQKGAVLVFTRSENDSGSSQSSTTTARLVVPSNQVGCLLGKGGAIISEIRKATGASVRIIGGGGGRNQVPKCVSASDEVVQISGNFSSVQDALYNATGRLRDNLLSNAVNSVGTRNVPSLLTETNTSPYGQINASSLINDTSSYGRIREPGPLIFASNEPHLYGINVSPHVGVTNSLGRQIPQNSDYRGPSYAYDRPPSPRQYIYDRPLSPRQYNFDRPLSPRQYTLERPPSPQPPPPLPPPRSWSSSQMIAAGVGARGMPETSSGLTSMRGGGGFELGSGNRSAIVTNTTVEIIVPENVVSSVYGENGTNLTRLRQISGARVIVHEPRLGTSDRVIVISGTPDETQAAQSLLHAFILTGPS